MSAQSETCEVLPLCSHHEIGDPQGRYCCSRCGKGFCVAPIDALDQLYDAVDLVLARGAGPELEAIGEALAHFARQVQ